jgi:tetratricopeptide (TPR) repeat protein
MNKIKAALFFVTTMLFVNFVSAQSIEDGRKFLYYEKYKSAKNVFEKLVAANPNNVDAVYWLGQAMIRPDDGDGKDIAGAKALYQKTLSANSNSALLVAGMGHIELLEGKTQDARNRFETAISLSQGKSIPVLNAIGFANADFDTKNGDAAYAVEKLKQATTLKGFKDPETYTILVTLIVNLNDGGSALGAYQSALAIDPKFARAKYRIGKIYQTQGLQSNGIFICKIF